VMGVANFAPRPTRRRSTTPRRRTWISSLARAPLPRRSWRAGRRHGAAQGRVLTMPAPLRPPACRGSGYLAGIGHG
jgi:hypothetical protein